MSRRKDYPVTPDGRYFVSRGRLWRCTDPALSQSDRRAAVKALMQARRAVQLAGDDAALQRSRADVDAAKEQLGERGPVWWQDGAADEGGRHPARSSYADWWEGLDAEQQARGAAQKSP